MASDMEDWTSKITSKKSHNNNNNNKKKSHLKKP